MKLSYSVPDLEKVSAALMRQRGLDSVEAAKRAQARDREDVYRQTGLRITEDGQIVKEQPMEHGHED